MAILSFWRDVEVFNIPVAPSDKDNTSQAEVFTLRRKDDLPWQDRRFAPTPQFTYRHVVHVGAADTEDLTRLLLQAVFPNQDVSERERQRVSGRGWLAAFILDETGRPKPDSYLPASVAHGVQALRSGEPLKNLNARLARAKAEFAERCHEMTEPSTGKDPALQATPSQGSGPSPIFGWPRLDDELRITQALLGDGAQAAELDWRVVVRVERIPRSKLEDKENAAIDHLNSFYLDDLDRLIQQARKNKPFGPALQTYLGTPLAQAERTDILQQNAAMGELVSAARLPSARWPAPAKFPLVLAQQAAVAQAIQQLGHDGAGGALGINGPPGTGKTTLLCDVIAEIVTKRARRIAAMRCPADLFAETVQVAGKNFFPLKPAVMAGSSIVVASSNNNAVKNITQELPARKKVSEEYGAADYFGEVAREVFASQKVLDEDGQPVATWGLMAAALGNTGNRRTFAQGFFRDEFRKAPASAGAAAAAAETQAQADDGEPDAGMAPQTLPPTIKQVLEDASREPSRYQAEWLTAKQRFQQLLAEVDAVRQTLLRAEQASQRMGDCRRHLSAQQTNLQELGNAIASTQQDLALRRRALDIQRTLTQARRASVTELQAATQPNLWDRLVALFGRETARMAALREALAQPQRQAAEAAEILAALAREARQIEVLQDQQHEQQRRQQIELAKLQREHRELHDAIQAGRDTGARHFPDDALWALPADERHRASVAVSPTLDTLRAHIFLQAMELHRLTVLANAGKFIGNLRAAVGMLTGKLGDALPLDQRPMLWDAFFFVVPVVSTTLASFDRLFAGMGQDSLGWLLVDEAGQATPQSAAGALWRSRRALLIGDPLQIEPVFTVPLGLVEELRRRHDVAALWSPNTESVQTLADRRTPYGSWVRPAATIASQAALDDIQPIWTGMPLRTHRRCDDPMFGVANRIAYANQMVQGRVDAQGRPSPVDFDCVLGDSTWWQVPTTRHRHPVVEDELDVLADCLHRLKRQPARVLPDGSPAKVYVITPFRKLRGACEQRLKKERLAGIECGTVHTFQGKEAEIVFLVLGTAPGQGGARARAWAAGKPNLLNVAVTRAKHRLYVIGDAEQWGGLAFFNELREALPRRSGALSHDIPMPPAGITVLPFFP
ncbi:DNA helicase [Diaphorobacter nitroreducens]|nr:DNA helicase [Diaphorobacter nitroreducens]